MLTEINFMIWSYTIIIISLIFAVTICFISFLKYKIKFYENIKLNEFCYIKENFFKNMGKFSQKKEVRHKSYSKR